jgi:prepilin-type processing-associated H-X9-DG protein
MFGWGPWGWWWGDRLHDASGERYDQIKRIMRCPMAARPANPSVEGSPVGGTFLAWGRGGEVFPPMPWYRLGSYGVNPWAHPYWYWYQSSTRDFWLRPDEQNGASIPVYLDCSWAWAYMASGDSPPPRDAIPTAESAYWSSPCINRHDGYVNSLFLDWSVRRIGLKELWTLRWHGRFSTIGPWTRMGGVEPEDWPLWMRRFKEY